MSISDIKTLTDPKLLKGSVYVKFHHLELSYSIQQQLMQPMFRKSLADFERRSRAYSARKSIETIYSVQHTPNRSFLWGFAAFF